MCVAIVTKKGTTLTSAELYNGWKINSDGGGIAYMDDNNRVQIESGFMTYNEFDDAYQRLSKQFANNGAMLVHMRIRSAGSIGKDNCHPFRIRNGAMIHNGTMFQPDPPPLPPKAGQLIVRKSDTRVFSEALYNILNLEHLQKAEKAILDAVGTHNKFAFLYDGGEYLILNEKSGTWDRDRWFSNSTCFARGDWSRGN